MGKLAELLGKCNCEVTYIYRSAMRATTKGERTRHDMQKERSGTEAWQTL
jgi:hypothetical protein